jgi:hypothetical protein
VDPSGICCFSSTYLFHWKSQLARVFLVRPYPFITKACSGLFDRSVSWLAGWLIDRLVSMISFRAPSIGVRYRRHWWTSQPHGFIAHGCFCTCFASLGFRVADNMSSGYYYRPSTQRSTRRTKMDVCRSRRDSVFQRHDINSRPAARNRRGASARTRRPMTGRGASY